MRERYQNQSQSMEASSQTTRYDRLLLLIIGCTVLTLCSASHFRGGTISWKYVNGRTFEFYFKLSWAYQRGPGCMSNTTGQFMEDAGSLPGRITTPTQYWKCVESTCDNVKDKNVSTVGYKCTGANKQEDWEQGERKFKYTFPNKKSGPFVIEFSNNNWMVLGGGKGNGTGRLRTEVDVRKRGDIGKPNSSPVAQSQAIYRLQYECHHELQIPTFDPDGDTVRCRWSQGYECGSVCNALPSATLNETTCTITFDATKGNTYKAGEYYGVAVTIEDYPQTNITLGSKKTITPSDALSSTPVQFLIQTPKYNTACEVDPYFMPPTPDEGSTVFVNAGETLLIEMVAHTGNDTSSKINAISISGPAGINQSQVEVYQSVPDAYAKNLTWDTKAKDEGTHLLCAYATNTKGKTSRSRCFTIEVGAPIPTTVTTTTSPTTTKTTAVAAIPLPLPPSCSPLPGIPFYPLTESCDTTGYCDCQCFISPNDPPEDDNPLRYLIAAFAGLLIGEVLSLLTTWLYYYCRRSPLPPLKVRRKRRPKAKKPITKTAPPCDTHHKKPAKKTGVYDRLARRMTCDRPWCEVHRHRNHRASIMSLRTVMKLARKK